ncbi:Hypothetical protein CINCED_3A025607 [Cinara cedri]|uniref:Uncharacterized protein n=1 Tax=Cinara cedri TaxID=506608 RepID=A0A5E4NK13_9HEMI|nr:Hypothetical protein CINCED_3A025607 [Cinara cedri]
MITGNHFHHFIENTLLARSEDIIKEKNFGEYKYGLYDNTVIKNENQSSMEQDIIFLDQNDKFSSSEYGLQLVNDKSYCNLICNEQKRSTFHKELPLDIDFQSPYVLGTTTFKIPSVIKQTIFNNKNRQNLEHSSAFKPVYRWHHDISNEETIRISNNKQHNKEYLSAFKPVNHSTHNERDEVKDINNIRQKIKHNSAFKVFNCNAYTTEKIRGISYSSQNQGYSSAFKPVYQSTQNTYDKITGIDYKRERLNENISSYLGENAENFFNYTTAQQINQSNLGTWVDVNYNFSGQQVGEVNSSNKICQKQNFISYTEKLGKINTHN